MKQLSGFSILNVNGMDRATFTYDEIDEAEILYRTTIRNRSISLMLNSKLM